MASKIGIKIANGEFYPLIEENSLIRKKMILTTVHDNQPSVQIDLYRSAEGKMADAQYIGSVVVENIKPKAKGDPSIELVISSDTNGEIVADAMDLDADSGGEHYVLTVSLKSFDETARDTEITDFELETEPPAGLYQHANRIRQGKKGSSFSLLIILAGLVLVLGLLAVWIFFFGGMSVIMPVIQPFLDKLGSIQIFSEKNAASAAAISVIKAPSSPPAPKPPASSRPSLPSSYIYPSAIPPEGINYRIRHGETLWDISETFYRDPWLYPRIAWHNNISNPNNLIPGRIINIPPGS